MGADGGIAWFKLKKPDQKDRLIKLLAPLNFQNLGSGTHWDNREEFLNKPENSFLWSDEYIYGYEGSYSYGATFESLRDIVSAIKDGEVQKELGFSQYDKTLSFGDIFLEKDTRPDWVYAHSYWCDKIIGWADEAYLSEEEKQKLFETNIVDWANEIDEILDIKSYCYEETWT